MIQDNNSRRNFLGLMALGATAAVAGMGSKLGAMDLAPVANHNDQDKWIQNALKGKYKLVLDGAEFNHALPVIWTWAYYHSNNSVGVKDEDMTALCVFRHNGLPFSLHDDIWNKYKLGAMFKIDDPRTNQAATRNPYFTPDDRDFAFPGIQGIKAMQTRGAAFATCNLAIMVYSGIAAKMIGEDPELAQKEWLAGVLPGIQVVPSGLWALQRAQQYGASYLFAG